MTITEHAMARLHQAEVFPIALQSGLPGINMLKIMACKRNPWMLTHEAGHPVFHTKYGPRNSCSSVLWLLEGNANLHRANFHLQATIFPVEQHVQASARVCSRESTAGNLAKEVIFESWVSPINIWKAYRAIYPFPLESAKRGKGSQVEQE